MRKRQKLQAAQKNKKDDRQYRDNMAYRMGLKKNEKLNSHNNLAKSSEILDDSESSDAEVIRETQAKNMQTERNRHFEPLSQNTRPSSESLTSRQEKSSSPVSGVNRPPNRMRKRITNPMRKKILRPHADFPDDLHALTTNISRFIKQCLHFSPTLHPPLVKDPKSPVQSGLVTVTRDNSYLLKQNEQILEAFRPYLRMWGICLRRQKNTSNKWKT